METFPRVISFPITSLGPFGGLSRGDNAWDDGTYQGIKKIEIATGDYVDSIRFLYADENKERWSEKHGGNGGQLSEVTLDYPEEFIVAISGYVDKDNGHLRSISFQTSLRRLGPFGKEEGEFFSMPKYNGKIVGFFGWSGTDHVNAIGAHVLPNPTYVYPPKLSGLFGGEGGSAFDDGAYTAIRQIEMTVEGQNQDAYLYTMQVQYDRGGRPVWGQKHGGYHRDGKTKYLVTLDYPREYIISVSGYFSTGNFRWFRSLTFETNMRKLGPYGSENFGIFFSTPKNINSKIVGFYGRSGWYIDAIGVYTVPIPIYTSIYPPVSLGPYGGQTANPWIDEGYDAIRQIEIASGDYVVSIRVQYGKAGRAVWSDKHGGFGGDTELVTLSYPDEFVISISGFIDKSTHSIRSLTFETNMRKLGPFGLETGESFETPKYEGKIVGFFGSSGNLINSIGAYMAPIWE